MKMEFSAGGIVYSKIDGQFKFALIVDTNGQWTFPKGHIEKDESPEDAAIRETCEEIGLNDLTIIELLAKSDYWFKFNNDLIHKYVYFYLIEYSGNEELKPQLSEIKDARWFSPDEAINIIGYKEQNQAILQKGFTILGITCESKAEDLK
jgi:8-oxo-dGTP pyrophosphatase MutT (NUDIX family)